MSTTGPSVSVVMTCLNAAAWLPETVHLAGESLKQAGITQSEFVIIDDGSTDDTAAIAKGLSGPYPIHVVRQAHQGRFLGRKAGVACAQYDNILFIDHRVHLHAGAMSFITAQLRDHPERKIWNGHIVVAKKGNLIARFGDAVTFIGWRRYFAHPTTTSYGLADFDYYPKGTGCFFVPKTLLIAATKEFEATTNDLEFSSDDTLLIRILARDNRINLSPQFSATYYARTTLRGFIKHTYHRGQFFVDGFLRPGTRFYYPLIGVFVISAAVLMLIIVKPTLIIPLIILLVLGLLLELAAALAMRLPAIDALSLIALSPLFVAVYGAGLWRGLLRKLQPGLNRRPRSGI